MMENKTKSNRQIFFATLAFIGYIIISLVTNLYVEENAVYSTFYWRKWLLRDVILFVPVFAIFIFSFLNRVLSRVSVRVYVTVLLAINVIQGLYMWLFFDSYKIQVFYCSFANQISIVCIGIIITRAILLVITCLFRKIYRVALEIYCISVIGYLALMLYAIICDCTGWWKIIYSAALIIDILYHISLLHFSGLANEEKEGIKLLGLSDLIWGDFLNLFKFTEDDEDDDFNEEDAIFKDKERKYRFNNRYYKFTNYSVEYKKVYYYAMETEDNEFLEIDRFMKLLAQETMYDENGLYSIEKLTNVFEMLSKKCSEIIETRPGYLDFEFTQLLRGILSWKEEKGFRINVILFAKCCFGMSIPRYLIDIRTALQQEKEGECADNEKENL